MELNEQVLNVLLSNARRCGKTYSLIQRMLVDPDLYMVVGNYQSRMDLSRSYGINKDRFISINSI